jgi:hypothetical protein
VLFRLIVISQILIKLLHLCLEGLLHGFLSESPLHLSLREIVIHSNGSVAPQCNSRLMNSRQTRILRGSIVTVCRIFRENTSRDILETDRPGIDGKCSENVLSVCWDYPTCDALMFSKEITIFCFCTVECRVYLLTSPMPMRSSSHMGSVTKIP